MSVIAYLRAKHFLLKAPVLQDIAQCVPSQPETNAAGQECFSIVRSCQHHAHLTLL